jgi:hypothetical protein
MTEPMTALTDYLLAGVSGFLGFRLLKHSKFWALAFLALALAALLGGTWHGFRQSDALWKATTLSVGVASLGMVGGTAVQTTSGIARQVVLAFAEVKFVMYTAWMLFHDDFVWVVADTAVALLIVGGLYLWRFNGWMLAGVAVSVLAGLAQASGLKLHAHFNHNDLYHVIQIAAMLAFYKGLKES